MLKGKHPVFGYFGSAGSKLVLPAYHARVGYKDAAKHLHSSGDSCPKAVTMTSDLVLPPSTCAREARLHSTSHSAPQSAPAKPMPRKSPKLWARRNAHVTPMNGPAPPFSEWPAVDFDPLQEFSKLHDYYGQEVKKAREEWLKGRESGEEEDKDLIDLL